MWMTFRWTAFRIGRGGGEQVQHRWMILEQNINYGRGGGMMQEGNRNIQKTIEKSGAGGLE